jgi:maleylpyruvate isomerase
VQQQHAQLLTRVEDAQQRLNATVAKLTDADAAAPSLLPGWTRGHVLSHLARNADGLASLLRWARTGEQTPMYPSQEARDSAIEAGAGRPAAELAADVRESAAALAAEAARMPDDAWTAQVRRTPTGDPFPASAVPLMRLTEVEIHHVDLAAGYGYRDWPREFVTDTLPAVAESFREREDAPPVRLTVTGESQTYLLGPAGAASPVHVHGAANNVLGWLHGRHTGEGLDVQPGPSLPVLPPFR